MITAVLKHSFSQYIIITVVTNIEKYTYALKQSVSVSDSSEHSLSGVGTYLHFINIQPTNTDPAFKIIVVELTRFKKPVTYDKRETLTP